MRPCVEREPPGLRALERRRLRVDDRHQRDPQQEVELQRDDADDERASSASRRQSTRPRGASRRGSSARAARAAPAPSRARRRARRGTPRRPARPACRGRRGRVAPCAVGPGEEAARRRPVHHVERERAAAAARSPATGTARAGTLRRARVDDDVEARAAVVERRGARARTACARRAPRDAVRPARALVDASGWRRRPRARRSRAAGRARRRRRRRRRSAARARRASATPALRSMSRTRPAPSVLSPSQPSASKRSMLQAPASARARRRARRRAANASNLNGIVTLQPLAAAGGEAAHRRGEAVERAEQPLVAHRLAGLAPRTRRG